jgi:hypothetical protein
MALEMPKTSPISTWRLANHRQLILLSSFCLLISLGSCGGGGDSGGGEVVTGCQGTFEIYQDYVDADTYNLNDQGIYNIPNRVASLHGTLNGHGFSVVWNNVTTVESGVASLYEYSYPGCAPFLGCYYVKKTNWDSGGIPLQLGPNSVSIYVTSNYGWEECRDITVTHPLTHKPMAKMLEITATGNVLVTLRGSFEDGGLPPTLSLRHGRDSNLTEYTFAPKLYDYSQSDVHDLTTSQTISDLLPGIQYYFQAGIQNDLGSHLSNIVSYTTTASDPTQPLPEISPYLSPSTVTATTASLGAWVQGNGDSYTHFTEYSDSPDFANYLVTPRQTQTYITSAQIAEGWYLTGLTPSTIYYYRHVAYNSGGTTITETRSFTTLAQ